MDSRPSAIIVDLDGTLANCDHRLHHIRAKPKNWPLFFENLAHDELNWWCAELVVAMKARGHQILLMTGRSQQYQKLSEEWLTRHQITFDKLYMRAENDFREDLVVKRELYETQVREHYQTLFVLEDRASVVAMWRELGLICLQCEVGDF